MGRHKAARPRDLPTAVEYLAAGVVRDISEQIADGHVKAQVLSIGKDMITKASASLVQSWEEGDDLCPPLIPFPFPFPCPPPFPWLDRTIFGPDPDPWKVASIGQLALADQLVKLAEITTDTAISKRLQEVSVALAKNVASNIVADLERTAVKPRAVG